MTTQPTTRDAGIAAAIEPSGSTELRIPLELASEAHERTTRNAVHGGHDDRIRPEEALDAERRHRQRGSLDRQYDRVLDAQIAGLGAPPDRDRVDELRRPGISDLERANASSVAPRATPRARIPPSRDDSRGVLDSADAVNANPHSASAAHHTLSAVDGQRA